MSERKILIRLAEMGLTPEHDWWEPVRQILEAGEDVVFKDGNPPTCFVKGVGDIPWFKVEVRGESEE